MFHILSMIYRMSLDVVGRSLTDFQSSHHFMSAIADAMEAHDVAFFDHGLFHCDISVGNIILTDDNQGMLIDWDLCAELVDDNDKPVACRPTRTGTWQFMSANLLKGWSVPHSHQDDRESAFYVLLWTALRYTETDTPPGSVYTPQNILRAFDEIFVDPSHPTGRRLGGVIKENLLWNYKAHGIVFTKQPELDSLMAELASVFSVRYESEPTDKHMAHLKKTLKKLEDANSEDEKQDIQDYLDCHVAYRYQQKGNKLEKEGWLADTIRKYLHMGQWPTDTSCAQVAVPSQSDIDSESW